MQQLYNLCFDQNSAVILFYKHDFKILPVYLVTLSDVDKLKLGKILEFLLLLWCSMKTFSYTKSY